MPRWLLGVDESRDHDRTFCIDLLKLFTRLEIPLNRHLLKFLLKFILRSCCQDLRPFKYHITMVPDIARRIHGHDNAVFNDLLHRSIFILHHFDLYLFRLQTRFSDILKPIRHPADLPKKQQTSLFFCSSRLFSVPLNKRHPLLPRHG